MSPTYSRPARVPQRLIGLRPAQRLAAIAVRKGLALADLQAVLFAQGHGRRSLTRVVGLANALNAQPWLLV